MFLTPGHSIVLMPGSYPVDQRDGSFERLVPVLFEGSECFLELDHANKIYSEGRVIDNNFNISLS